MPPRNGAGLYPEKVNAIAELEIEIKQLLKIKSFLCTSANAVIIRIARKAKFNKERVLNTKSAAEFEKWILNG